MRLTVVGEVYGHGGELPALIERAGLADRVLLRPGYLPAERIPELFAEADALVLPYRTATASQLVALAHEHGLPAVVDPGRQLPGRGHRRCGRADPAHPATSTTWCGCCTSSDRPGRLAALRAAVRPADPEPVWRDYLATLLTLGAPVPLPQPANRMAPP